MDIDSILNFRKEPLSKQSDEEKMSIVFDMYYILCLHL